MAHPEDCLLAEEVAKNDYEVQRKLRKEYGITDLSLVACDPWSGSHMGTFCSRRVTGHDEDMSRQALYHVWADLHCMP